MACEGALYAIDKRSAIKKGGAEARSRDVGEAEESKGVAIWRVPEKTLHGMALSGGWPGAWLAMELFNHKTAEREFQSAFRVSVVLHCILVSLIIWCTYLYTLVAQLVGK